MPDPIPGKAPQNDTLSRRQFLQLGGLFAGALALRPLLNQRLGEESISSSDNRSLNPKDVLKWIKYEREKSRIRLPFGLGTIMGLLAFPLVIRQYGLKKGAQAIGAGAVVDLLTACAPQQVVAQPDGPTPTPEQKAEVTLQATALVTSTQTVESTATPAALPTLEPTAEPNDLLLPSTNQIPSAIEGLALGQIKIQAPGQEPVITTSGTVEGYLSPINTLYKPEEPDVAQAFGIDQLFLISYFKAEKQANGDMVGTSDGAKVILTKRGVWKTETDDVFIPFIKSSEGIYEVIDANGKIQQIEMATGKKVGRPRAKFESPQAVAQRMKLTLDNIVGAGLGKGGCLEFVCQEVVPATNTSPERTVQVVNEIDFIAPPEDYAKNEVARSTVNTFTDALNAAGLTVVSGDLLKKGFSIRRIEIPDPTDPTQKLKKTYDIASISLDDKTVGGEYPLMIRAEGEDEWKSTPMRMIADGAGMKVGTFIFDKYSGATPDVQKFTVENFNEGYVTIDSSETEKNPGQFTFQEADALVKIARENGMTITAGHLVYGASDFSFGLAKTKKNASKEELIQLIKDHIKGVMTHFKGQIGVWSVVNESGVAAWHSDADPYANLIGEDVYIDTAFETARATDPDAVLMYCQGLNETRKSDRYQMTLDIVNRLKSKKLIDGVGLQMHLNQNKWDPPSKAELIATFKSYGVPINITELDVNMEYFEGTPAEKEAKQAQIYRDIFEACVESGVCKRVNFWGVGDKYSWYVYQRSKQNADPTILHDDLTPKLAYYEVLRALYNNLQS